MRKQIIFKVIVAFVCFVSLFGLSFNSIASASKKVKLNHTNVTMTKGEAIKLSLKGANKNKVKWSTNKSKIIKVYKTGKIKALRVGKANVRANHKGKKYVCKVSVIATTQQTTETNMENVNVLKDVYVSNVLGNEYDWFVMIDYVDKTNVQKYSNSFKSFSKAEITINGEKADVSELKKGDNLEVGYVGQLPDNTFTTIPDIKYVKASR